MKYCENCGRKLPDEGAICPYCHPKPESQTAPADSENIPSSPHVPKDSAVYKFEKDKGFSYATYKTINTVATIQQESLDLESQITWFAFIKRPPKQTSIPLDQIVGVQTKFTWDFWDAAFAIFVLLVFFLTFQWWLLLIFALFVFTAMGYSVEIALKNGVKWRIPYGLFGNSSNFVNALQKAIPRADQAEGQNSEQPQQETEASAPPEKPDEPKAPDSPANLSKTAASEEPKPPKTDKRFCPACGKEADGNFCTYCGAPIPPSNPGTQDNGTPPAEPNGNADTTPSPKLEGSAVPAKRLRRTILTLVVVVIAVVAIALVATAIRKQNVISDVKGIVFENYTTHSIGYTTNRTLSNPKWSVEKMGNDYYWVTVSGYSPDLYSHIDAIFDVYYYDDYVSASLNYVLVDGDYYDDETSLFVIMGILCDA